MHHFPQVWLLIDVLTLTIRFPSLEATNVVLLLQLNTSTFGCCLYGPDQESFTLSDVCCKLAEIEFLIFCIVKCSKSLHLVISKHALVEISGSIEHHDT